MMALSPHRRFRSMLSTAALACLIGVWIVSCAARPPAMYSLADREIFIAPQPHVLNLAVAVFEDHRAPEEKSWSSRIDFPSRLTGEIHDRLVQHLQTTLVFKQVQSLPRMADPPSPELLQDLISQGVDALLVGTLEHFYGRVYPDRRIEGHVEFINLKLYSTHTGRVLWQGTADKLIQRQEKSPGRDDYYATEALRGAVNQLAIQLSQASFRIEDVYASDLPAMRQWRVAVMTPEDLRPPEERDREVRNINGNLNYTLYSDDLYRINESFLCGILAVCYTSATVPSYVNEVREGWIQKLKEAGIFGYVMGGAHEDMTKEGLRRWFEEGVDAVLLSQLVHSYAFVAPLYDEKPFPIWTGGMGFPPRFKAAALSRIEAVQLIETRTGKLLWSGEAEYGIDKTINHWVPPSIILRSSLAGALDRVVMPLSQLRLSE